MRTLRKQSPVFLLSKLFFIGNAAIFLSAATTGCLGQVTIAAKQNHNLYVSLQNQSGRLSDSDEYCVQFSKSGSSVQVGDVSLQFAQQVGKVRHSPLTISLVSEGVGRFCGKVKLGKQYYHPAFYYVEVRYSDSSNRTAKCKFFLVRK